MAKLYAYWITVSRESYGCGPATGVVQSRESAEGETFVTRKMRAALRLDAGLDDCLYMGNLDSLRPGPAAVR